MPASRSAHIIASGVTPDWEFNELLLPQILRGCSLMLCMVPITNLSLGTLPPEQLKNASGLFNLTRNLGGAVGLAVINTLLNHRLDLHLARLHESVAWGRPIAEDQLASMQQSFTVAVPDGGMAALKQLAMLVRRQANVHVVCRYFHRTNRPVCDGRYFYAPDAKANGRARRGTLNFVASLGRRPFVSGRPRFVIATSSP